MGVWVFFPLFTLSLTLFCEDLRDEVGWLKFPVLEEGTLLAKQSGCTKYEIEEELA
jgi:hypothetical protein